MKNVLLGQRKEREQSKFRKGVKAKIVQPFRKLLSVELPTMAASTRALTVYAPVMRGIIWLQTRRNAALKIAKCLNRHTAHQVLHSAALASMLLSRAQEARPRTLSRVLWDVQRTIPSRDRPRSRVKHQDSGRHMQRHIADATMIHPRRLFCPAQPVFQKTNDGAPK